MRNKLTILYYLIFISVGLILISGVFFFVNYNNKKEEMYNHYENKINEISETTKNKLENYIRNLIHTPEDFSIVLQNGNLTEENLKIIIKNLVLKNKEIYGLCPAYEEYQFDGKTRFFEPYFYKSGDSLMYVNYDIQPEDYFAKDWYKKPKQIKAPAWIEPYADSTAGMKIMTTYSIPFFDNKGNLKGILATDIFLNEFQKYLSEIQIMESGYVFLFSEEKTILIHPKNEYILKETMNSLSSKLNQPVLRFLADSVSLNKTGFTHVKEIFHVAAAKVYFTQLSSKWGLVIVFPEKEMQIELEKLKNWSLLNFFISIAFILIFLGSVYFTFAMYLKNKQKEELEKIVAAKTKEITLKNSLLEKQKLELNEKTERIVTDEEILRQSNEELKTLNENIEFQRQLIKQNETRLRTIINNQGEGFGITDFNEIFTFANLAACEIFNIPAGTLVGRSLREFFDDTEWAKIIEQTKLRKTAKKSSYEVTMTLADKTKKHILVTGAPDFDSKGKIVGTIATFRDITQLKEEQEKVKKLNLILNKYFIAIEQNPTAIIFTDTNGIIEYVNPQFTKHTGYSKEEIIGKNPRLLKSDKTPKETFENLWKTITSGKTWYGILTNKKKDGTVFIEKSIISPIFNEEGTIINYIALKEDITELVKAEESIKIQNETIKNAHQDITDSIEYAKNIQNAFFTSNELLNCYLKDYFLIYRPKNVVSGDFYYINKINNNLIVAIADCTGHGVPGGFMTILGIIYLHDIVKREIDLKSSEILNKLRENIKEIFRTFGSENINGLDIAFCKIDVNTNVMQYAGANMPLYIIRNNDLKIHEPTKNPIGFFVNEKSFENNVIQLEHEDLIYLFTDGFADQYGGAKKCKLSLKRLQETLLKIRINTLSEQKEILESILAVWQGNNEQTDDITILGIKW